MVLFQYKKLIDIEKQYPTVRQKLQFFMTTDIGLMLAGTADFIPRPLTIGQVLPGHPHKCLVKVVCAVIVERENVVKSDSQVIGDPLSDVLRLITRSRADKKAVRP
jgi:hypothetical protein